MPRLSRQWYTDKCSCQPLFSTRYEEEVVARLCVPAASLDGRALSVEEITKQTRSILSRDTSTHSFILINVLTRNQTFPLGSTLPLKHALPSSVRLMISSRSRQQFPAKVLAIKPSMATNRFQRTLRNTMTLSSVNLSLKSNSILLTF